MTPIREAEYTIAHKIEFESIFQILIHYLCSIIQLICILTILGLQITLTITQTCTFNIGVAFWSFPFLLLSPISIWIFLWKRNIISYFLSFIIHICSNLFATIIILISFLTLIGQIPTTCLTSNNYYLSINISLIVVSICLKALLYGEIILLYIKKSFILLDNTNITKTYNAFILDFDRSDDIDV